MNFEEVCGIKPHCSEIEEKLQATKDAQKEAETKLLEAEAKAKEIIADAENEAKILSRNIAEKNENALSVMEKQAVDKQSLESKKATRATIANLLNNGFENDDIAVDEAKVVSLISKKVA
jgi:F0F1-type ATP synthase membrane subunit b/b'